MLSKIDKYINQNQLFKNSAKLIVGLSGGADSMALIDILNRLHYNCIAAHCNFHLRGDESDGDAQFVTDWCKTNNIELISIDFDTYKYAEENKISIEMAARDLRYTWFEKIRQKYNADYIAVAHHQNDSIETLLINLIRGTGISGLTGISPKNGKVVRPLLSISRTYIEQYLNKRGIPYRTDNTNLQDIYTRNYVRLNLLPAFEKLNPSVNEAIARTTQNLIEVEKVYRAAINKDIESVLDNNRINIDTLRNTISPQSVLFEILSPLGFSPSVIDDVSNSINSTPGKVFYSHTHRLLKDREYYEIDLISESSQTKETYHINSTDKHLHEPLKLDIKIEKAPVSIIKSRNMLYADADLIKYPLILRKWHAGDWFIPFGMKGKKKLSDFFTDQKFSLKDKEEVWILTSEDDILWVVGHRSDDRFKITKKTNRVLCIELKD